MKNFLLRLSFIPAVSAFIILFLPMLIITILGWFVIGSKSFDLMSEYVFEPFIDYANKVFDL